MGPYRPEKPPRPPKHVTVRIPADDFKEFVRWYAKEALGVCIDDFDEVQLSWVTKPGGMANDIMASMWRNQETYDRRYDDEPSIGENSM